LPTLTSISPANGAQGTSVPVTLAGTHFVAGEGIAAGNSGIAVSNVTVVSAAQITATFTIAANAATGAANVTVTTSGGASNAIVFTVNPPAPTLATVSPASGVQGNSLPVTLTGSNFVAGATVAVSNTGIAVSNVTVVSATQITATLTIAANAATGAANVTVTTSGGTSNAIAFTVNTPVVAPPPTTVTNVSSTAANGPHGTGAVIPITVTFSAAVTVTGTPQISLNSGGTAIYTSGSGTSTLTFTYTVAAGNGSADLDASSSSALALNGGTITDSSSANAVLTLPIGAATGSLPSNKSISIDTVAPTVVSYSVLWGAQSYNVIGTARNRLPWQISGIQVVFSKPITGGNVSSLSGIPTTGLAGLGTNTLSWTITPQSIGLFTTQLAGSGANALTDVAGNPMAGGAGFSQNLKILWGDFNDDGYVNAQDLVLVNNAISQAYNIFADMDGDGVVTVADVQIVRAQAGTTLP
jgi:hypothetical protein